ncbi:phage tail assembly protein T [Sulfurovum mangrovi]|uniref:phage tail assembly protein T n=1 Tax=Sulfurovum mangrovi TaxID=2893889 RepID=UPI001E52BE6C|nr:hypothetical protein [Sulfurovum mangrovi]UFH59838.1 hypothetical protein LN246_03095 [Sulfurovum mangrovi]UFH59889.1 hypothetical protein LN246_03355 [Sulfurovum mangrovi]
MSKSEFEEWKLFYKDNLFPMDRNEIQMAQLMHMISPFFIKNAKIEDFLVRARLQKPKTKTSDLVEKVKKMFRSKA